MFCFIIFIYVIILTEYRYLLIFLKMTNENEDYYENENVIPP